MFSPFLRTLNIAPEAMSVLRKCWQTTRTTIRERNKFMFNDDLYSDVKSLLLEGRVAELFALTTR